MGIPVAVVDPLPSYQAGLAAALTTAGFAPEEPTDLGGWVRLEGRRAVVLTLEPLQGHGRLADLRAANADIIIVALLSEPGLNACRQTLELGGCCVLPRQASPRAVVRALEAALEGHSVLPLDIARSFAAEYPCSRELTLDGDEVRWLRSLAYGTTVTRLAEDAGYSERTMYRRLTQLYRRLRVSNRIEAVVQAARLGLLD
jgi:DNA-binding NarL/FixJ family response regulator